MHPYPDWLRRTIALFLFLLLIASSSFLMHWMYSSVDRRMRASFEQEARLVADAVNLESIRKLSGTDADLEDPSYQRLKRHFASVKNFKQEYRFIYLVGRRPVSTAASPGQAGDELFIYVDNEAPDSKDYSPPGQVYEEASEGYWRIFDTKKALVKGPFTDRWGRWVSALIPINDPLDNTLMAVLGVDIDAGAWKRELIRHSIIPVAFMTFLLGLLLLFEALLLARRARCPGPLNWWMRHLETLSFAAIGVTVSIMAAYLAHNLENFERNAAFTKLAEARTDSFPERLHAIKNVSLESLARFYEGSEEVTTEEFRHYTEFLITVPIVQAWGWCPAVPAAERASFEAEHRSPGATHFHLWQQSTDGHREPAPVRDLYYPVSQIAPFKGHESILGFDFASEPLIREKLDEAVHTGLPTATKPNELLHTTEVSDEMLVLRPVFRPENTPEKPEGFVFAVLGMAHLLRTAAPDDLVYKELSLLGLEGLPEILATSRDREHKQDEGLSLTRPAFAFGKTFAISAYEGPDFTALYPLQAAWRTFLFGIIFSGAIVLVVGLVIRRREALEALVRERTTELRESEEQHRIFAEMTSDFVYIYHTGPDGRPTFDWISESFVRVVGYSIEEYRSFPEPFQFIHPDDIPAAIENHQRVISGESTVLETRIITKSGDICWVRNYGKPIWDEDHRQVVKVYGAAQDITERKAAEAERERLIMAFEQAAEIVFITDATGIIQYVNQAFERVTGYSRQEAIGQNPRFLKSGKHDDAFYRHLWETIGRGEAWEGRMVNRRKDGSLYTEEATIAPARDASGQIVNFIAVKRDITHDLELEEQILQAQKMESVGRLAGGIAHDFNNMLGVILGHTEMAAVQMDPSQPLYFQLQEIRKAAERSADLTRQLLAFARKQTIAPVVLDLNLSVEAILQMLRRLIGEDIDLAWRPSSALWPLCMDPSQIDQILANLCVNARDAIAGVGKVTIETDNVVFDQSYCDDHPEFAPGQYVMLAVSDNGCGMSKEILGKLFEPFFTTKETGKGTGLGLPMVYGIVRQNNGFINVYSEPGQGTTFKIYLPRHDGPDKVSEPESRSDALVRGHETILLVEDEPALLKLTATILDRQGYTVLAAATPGEAIRLAQEHAENIHLLVTDVVMPEMNGRDLAKHLKSLYPNLKCLFMSGYTANVIAHHGVLDEEVHFIQKPFTMKDIAEKVREALA